MNKLRTLLVALLGLSAVLLSGCGSSRRAIHYYLPKDYTGWFVVYYDLLSKEWFSLTLGAASRR